MDLIDMLLQGHERLRGSLKTLDEMLGRPSGVGWDDRTTLDRTRFSLQLGVFLATFKAHEAVERAYLSRIVRQIGLDPELDAAVDEGHRSLEEMLRLFSAVATSYDGDHVYRLRTVLSQLSAELERHLIFEETQVFPRLRESLPAGLLRELGRRAGPRRRAGLKAGARRPSAAGRK